MTAVAIEVPQPIAIEVPVLGDNGPEKQNVFLSLRCGYCSHAGRTPSCLTCKGRGVYLTPTGAAILRLWREFGGGQ